MTGDKQNENFITQQQTKENNIINSKNIANTIISHNSNRKTNKFDKAITLQNARLMMLDFSTLNAEAQPRNRTKTNFRKQTMISKVSKQKIPTMAQQALKQTHMTLKEYFEFSNAANTQTTTKNKTTVSKTINKNMYAKQREQNIDQKSSTINSGKQQYQLKLRSTIASATDPAEIIQNFETISSSSISSSLLPPTTKLVVAATAEALTIPVTRDAVENSQSKIKQCNNVCISSKCGSKQKCTQKQQQHKHKQHSKSANIYSSTNNFNNIRTFSKTNINTHITDTSADAASTYSSATKTVEEDTRNTNIITTSSTTNKANIIFNTISKTTTTIHHSHTDYIAATTENTTDVVTTTRPTELSTSAAVAATTYCKAFPLRQRFYQNTKQLECLLRTVLFSFMFVMSMQYQTVSASTSMMSKHEPMFISRSETFKFVAGDTIVLPCEVANTDPYVVAWKRGIAILTAGSVKVTPDPRVRLVNGFNLQIRDAVPQDAGDYICQIATMEPREITHTVEILVPPRIHHISTSGHLQVKKGSSVRIECSASGNPTPNVTWSRKNNILPNGEEKLHSHILSIENVDRHKGGVYICTANNGVGQPASSQVVLHVLYPPEITVERPVVFSGEGHEAMLVCIVHGETQPEVIWFKDTMQLDTTERHIMENRGSRHTLIIRKVHPQDFGNYSCVAENQLGKSRKTLQLSGKPNVAVFNSPPISQYKDRYNISWTVESHTPIEEYKLSFRRLQQGQEVDNSIDSHSSSSSSVLQMYGGSSSMMGVNAHNYRLGGINSMNSMGNSGGYGSYGAGNVIHWGRNDWRDVVLPAIPTSHHYTQGMSYMIRGLDPDQHYEATVQARNRYGWSDYSQSFVFSTSSNDNEMRDLSVTFYGSKTSPLQTLNSLLFLAAAACLCVINFNY
ncbi:uncharacterized protein LOC111675782 isoform X2 [Lucilia cuprina]|uniref:uncharacterized protein LOC111675782 isoform X2 n=1 Tax=Lucilia cuprina TaxID=7375 RepID=UPI001F054262|nr:uncharacterized protein LOC111675782 isoform X2 [Lucilia cuprina]